MSPMARRVAVLGAGSWGTALAMLLQRQGVPTVLWGRDPDAIAAMRESGQNRRYLPDLPLPEGLELSSDLEAAAELLPAGTPLAVITGPSFAQEVARGLPTAVTVHSDTAPFAAEVAQLL